MLCAADLAKLKPAKYLPLPSPKELELLNTDELVLVGFCNREDVWCAAPLPQRSYSFTRAILQKTSYAMVHTTGVPRERRHVDHALSESPSSQAAASVACTSCSSFTARQPLTTVATGLENGPVVAAQYW